MKGKPLQSKPDAIHKKAITAMEISPNGKGMITASTGKFSAVARRLTSRRHSKSVVNMKQNIRYIVIEFLYQQHM